MKLSIPIRFIDGDQYVTVYTPELCPHCGRTMSPQHVGQSMSDDSCDEFKRGHFSVIYRCSYADCLKYFVIEYQNNYEIATPIEYSYRPPIKVNLPKNIEKVSPMFVEIYSQAEVAETENLDLIAGVGYRKAAEFLIKDYAISKNPDKEKHIKDTFLNNVIQEYFSDFPKLKALSVSIAWLGNDETHYVRRHNDKDLQDLKRFIQAAAQFIAADYDADEASSFIS